MRPKKEIRATSPTVRAIFRRIDEIGMPQHEVARRAGIEQSRVAEYRRGAHMPSIAMAEALAGAVGLRIVVELDT